MGLEALIRLGRKNIVVQSDSQLLVRQLNGEYRVKDEKLKELFQRAVSLLRQFDSYRIVHVRREFNRLADRIGQSGHRRSDQKAYRGLKWIKRSRFVLRHEARKVRTPKDTVAVNDGSE